MSEIPSAWNSYVSVDDVDALMAPVTESGGQIIQPPFDVPEGARIAVIRDPGGAALCLFQSRGNVGSTLVNTPGALCWNELWTADLQASKAFYGALFGWTYEADPNVPIYTILLNRGRRNGGILAMGEEMAAETPPTWLPHFSVADIEAAARRIVELGGAVQVGPRDDGDGKRWLLFSDPQGPLCYLMQLDRPEPWLEHEACSPTTGDQRGRPDMSPLQPSPNHAGATVKIARIHRTLRHCTGSESASSKHPAGIARAPSRSMPQVRHIMSPNSTKRNIFAFVMWPGCRRDPAPRPPILSPGRNALHSRLTTLRASIA